MKIIDDPGVVQQMAMKEKRAGKRIGVVPTMGALHEGHLSLVRRSKREADTTIVTIFVNPTQFGPAEDLDKYPRTLEGDLELLEKLEVDTVFVPTNETMYPQGFETFVAPGKIADCLEGKMRPAHFRGVTTIVLKLFHITGADVAFFGQKDYQQCCVVKKMIDDFNLPVKMVVCPIVREPDGLAMSSRNRYLSAEERRQAVVLSQGLDAAQKMLDALVYSSRLEIPEAWYGSPASQGGCARPKAGTHTGCGIDTDAIPVDPVRNEVRKTISAAPLAKIDNISIVDPVTLDEIGEIRRCNGGGHSAVILLAVHFGTTRLIDNALVTLENIY
ncbi:MAG: pantoate--beta-alanine ligase [Planctomycetaceae bacterium]|nr:pantoate--beta-alanine ligase [Planctomycetaceae bacterium]